MPKSLTKKYIRMVSQDDAGALLEALGSPMDPRDFHIQDDLLPLRCARYGKARCFVALVEARPDLAEELCSMSDGNNERCIDWMGTCATPDQIATLARLAPIACSQGSRLGLAPLSKALSHGLWDSASAWLSLDPPAAALNAAGGRGAILLAAEPAYEIRDDEGLCSAWTPPPQALIDDLFLHGADPKNRSDKKLTALSRAISGGSHRVFDAILSRVDNCDMPLMLARGELAFNPLHEAVWREQPEMLASLAARGGDLAELTDQKFSLLHLAIRQNSKKCAQVLIDLDHRPDADPASSTTSACSAMMSLEPVHWIEWLGLRGVDLDQRDDHGAHWLELAWERLSFEQAQGLWDKQPIKPMRSAESLLGPLERAARSKFDAVRKVSYLLAEGLFPARIDAAQFDVGSASASPGELLSSLRSRHVNGVSFGVYKHVELGAMWATAPEATAPGTEQGRVSNFEIDDDDPFSTSTSPRPSASHHPRPCLLAYAASLGQTDVAKMLIEWGAPRAFWSDADVLCAWREALRLDANLPTLRLLCSTLAERGVPLWGAEERHAAMQHLGPAKIKEFGALLPSVGEALSRSLLLNPQCLPEVFLLRHELLAEHNSYFRKELTTPEDVDLHPWRVGLGSEHLGTIKALLPLDSPMPAISAMHMAMACARAKKPELALWASLRCKDLAAKADPCSPWGKNPEQALGLWDEQMRHELEQACIAHPTAKLPTILSLPEGAASSILLSKLVLDHSLAQARKLIELGIKAPLDFTRLAESIEHCAQEATAMGKGNELLEPLRAFCHALCERADFRSILDKGGERSMISRLPDPALLDTFLFAGASVVGGTNNSFVELCLKYAGRLSPAFAGHLADLSCKIDPTSPLAVASALASMKSHNTNNSLSLEPSTASRLRLERATRNTSPEGWSTSFEHDFCPVEAAFNAGNVELGLGLAERAPAGYCLRAGANWPALWIKARAPIIAKALNALANNYKNNDELLAAPALASMSLEIESLAALGLPLSTPNPKDVALAAAGIEQISQGKTQVLSWLLERGWRPHALIPIDDFGYQIHRGMGRLFGRDEQSGPDSVPLLAIVLAADGHSDHAVDLCFDWARAGLPTVIMGKDGKTAPCHLLLDGARASLYESRLIQAELGSDEHSELGNKISRRL